MKILETGRDKARYRRLAIRRIEVRDLPAFVVYDGRGGDLYATSCPRPS